MDLLLRNRRRGLSHTHSMSSQRKRQSQYFFRSVVVPAGEGDLQKLPLKSGRFFDHFKRHVGKAADAEPAASPPFPVSFHGCPEFEKAFFSPDLPVDPKHRPQGGNPSGRMARSRSCSTP